MKFPEGSNGDKEITPSATQSASMTELATNVANDPNGIGYVGFGAFNKANKESTVLKEIKVDDVEASEEKILSGDYKIQRPVMFVTGRKSPRMSRPSLITFSPRQATTRL